MAPNSSLFEKECRLRGIYYEIISASQVNNIYSTIQENNMEKVLLEKAPRVAVYTPPNSQPWDDAVTLALNYAEISYDQIYDTKVLAGLLSKYDWLHLHHEDFTGQYGKFWASFKNEPWYIEQQRESENLAKQLGFAKVSQLKGRVAEEIKRYVDSGGFLFAMCSATDALDIALAAENDPPAEVVGLVRDAKYRRADLLNERTSPHFWLPRNQSPARVVEVLFKTRGDPALLFNAVRQEVRLLDDNLPIKGLNRIEDASHIAHAHKGRL